MLAQLRIYTTERLTIQPWGVLALALTFIAYGPQTYRFEPFVYVAVSLYFYRTLDDYFCFELDQQQRQDHYLRASRLPIIWLAVILGAAWLGTLLMFASDSIFLANIGLLVASIVLYRLLINLRAITFVSILKYPIILGSVAVLTVAPSFGWVIAASALLLIREFVEETYQVRRKDIEVFTCAALIIVKLSLRYLI